MFKQLTVLKYNSIEILILFFFFSLIFSLFQFSSPRLLFFFYWLSNFPYNSIIRVWRFVFRSTSAKFGQSPTFSTRQRWLNSRKSEREVKAKMNEISLRNWGKFYFTQKLSCLACSTGAAQTHFLACTSTNTLNPYDKLNIWRIFICVNKYET